MENDLDRIRNASSQQELMDSFKEFGKSVVELSERAAQRQADLKVSLRSHYIKSFHENGVHFFHEISFSTIIQILFFL